MNSTAMIPLQTDLAQDFFNDSTWLQFFDVQEALYGLDSHIGNLGSDKTPEQYTRDSYTRGVLYFIEWAGGLEMRLPNEQLLTDFVAHLLHEKEWYRGQPPKDGAEDTREPQYGVSASTVASNYLAPVRIFLKKLVKQATPHRIQINPFDDIDTKNMKRDMRDFFIECKEQMRTALDEVKNPRQQKSNVSALWNPKFNRLKKRQVRKLLRFFDRSTIVGARDYLIFKIPFECGLRVAELQRISLSSLKQNDNGIWEIIVRGKRSNFDGVPISKALYKAILDYVELYNAPLDADDPRRIGDSNPIFQAMRKGGGHPELGNALYDAQKGLSKGGIREIIKKITAMVLKVTCTPHDLRRTYASLAFNKAKMAITDIQSVMRHADATTTFRYIGNKPSSKDSLITEFMDLE
jgi:integrase